MSKLRDSDSKPFTAKTSIVYDPPLVYYKQGPPKKDLLKYSYNGNFNDIQHLGNRDKAPYHLQPLNNVSLKFASTLRNYDS